jgi:CHAT domain-containing protein
MTASLQSITAASITAETPHIIIEDDIASNDFSPIDLFLLRSQNSGISEGSSNGATSTLDVDFPTTTVDDVCRCSKAENKSQELAAYLPSKIVFEARNKCLHAVRTGFNDDGEEALEEGLQTLRNHTEESSDAWRLGEVEILLDLGRKEEARKTLSRCRIAPIPRGHSNSIKRPQLQASTSNVDAQFLKQYLEYNSRGGEALLDVSIRAEDWAKARAAAAELLRIDPSYFDIQKPIDRFRECRRMLNLGLLEEHKDPGFQSDQTRKNLGEALRIYNHGCFATELFHEYYDLPQAPAINGFDHSDCTNLFFSAAKICVLFSQTGIFDELGKKLTPKKFSNKFKEDKLPCSPPLTEIDWLHQALYFMEKGRSRALLDLILSDDDEKPLITGVKRKYLMADVVMAAKENEVLRKKRDSYLLGMQAISPENSTSESFQEQALLGLNDDVPSLSSPSILEDEIILNKGARPLALQPLLDTAGLNDYKAGDTLPSSPSSYEGSNSEEDFQLRKLAKMKARLLWKKAIFHAFAGGDISSIRRKIPEDTAVIEYALTTASSEGLISLVVTSVGIVGCAWQKVDNLQGNIKELLRSMTPPDVNTRDSGTPSPRQQRFSNAFDPRQNLQDILIKPIEQHLAGKKKLIIIPSGELAHVPWTMLLSLPISIIPSLSIWDHLLSHAQPETSSPPSKVSVVGNPPYNPDGTLRNKDIPFSYLEAFYIARMNGDFPFIANDNNKKGFRSLVSKSRVLHLCAHSTFDDQDPVRSGVQLFREPLTISDLRDLAIKADLVVFSSCLSGFSKAFHSGSAFGFAHTLLGTGTRAFIGSLWPVDDLATLLLMMMFYEALQEMSPAEALHVSKMRMRELKMEDVWELVDRLKEVTQEKERVMDYVDVPDFWIGELDKLEEHNLQSLREPRCWAAFVLTGYGFQEI